MYLHEGEEDGWFSLEAACGKDQHRAEEMNDFDAINLSFPGPAFRLDVRNASLVLRTDDPDSDCIALVVMSKDYPNGFLLTLDDCSRLQLRKQLLGRSGIND